MYTYSLRRTELVINDTSSRMVSRHRLRILVRLSIVPSDNKMQILKLRKIREYGIPLELG